MTDEGEERIDGAATQPAANSTGLPKAGQWFDFKNPELVIGIVASVGTDLESFQATLQARLRQYHYEAEPIRVSEFLKKLNLERLGVTLTDSPEYDRLLTHMGAGTKLREKTYNYVLALHVAASIMQSREQSSPTQADASQAIDVESAAAFRPKTAYIVRSLKHPEEVHALRKIYGTGFYLIGVFSPREDRLRNLTRDMTDEQASTAMDTDEDEKVDFGQKTRDTFELADIFVTSKDADEQLEKVFDLVFGNPFGTPTRDEHGMFLAYAASVRSGSLSRQVGAAIMSKNGEILATGSNDTPAFGGGLYWPGDADRRDFKLGIDSNDKEKDRLVLKIMQAFGREGSQDSLRREGKRLLKQTGLLDLTEFGRDVHAEMDALLSCARIGVSPRGGTLYCTTFPCHNCAKHLVAAGIRRVIYVEPYPKSRALDLHSDAISTDQEMRFRRVVFQPFVGVGPRRYFDLFSCMGISTGFRFERKEQGRPVNWHRGGSAVRVPMRPNSYLERERLAAEDLKGIIEWLEMHGGEHHDPEKAN